MMENVPGLANRGKPMLNQFLKRIGSSGYIPNVDVLQAADYGVPQNRKRLVVLAGNGFEIPMPTPSHSKNGDNNLPPWRTVRETISGLPAPVTLAEAKAQSLPGVHNWHIVRSMSESTRLRLKYAKPGKSWAEIPEDFRPDCHKNNFNGFRNVYGRMEWDEVAPTITTGCTTLSKGRFGHPVEERTISVREAALLQTFPPDYVIETPSIERACSIIGNAFPCKFAEAIAKECHTAILANTS